MMLPLGVDPTVKAELEEACAAAEDPAFIEFTNNNGQTIAYQNSADYAAFLAQSMIDVPAAMETVDLV